MTNRFPAAWGVSDPVLVADTTTSLVHRVRLADGRLAIVKHLTPIGADELSGADYLAWRAGRGAVRLLARNGMQLLLEDAGPISLLDELEAIGDTGATGILIDILAELHAPSRDPLPEGLPSLTDWFASLFAQAAADTDSLVAEAAGVVRQLLADQRDVGPLHGDLHHGNVHRSERGWLAIDPKGLIGDAAYDAANLFCNPLDREDLRTDPDRIRGIAAAFADRFGRDSEEVLRWGFAHACLSASWHLDDGNADEASRSLGVGRAIRSVLPRR